MKYIKKYKVLATIKDMKVDRSYYEELPQEARVETEYKPVQITGFVDLTEKVDLTKLLKSKAK